MLKCRKFQNLLWGRLGCGRIVWQSFVSILHNNGQTMLKSISKWILIKIYPVVQELWAFILIDHNQPDWCSVKPWHHYCIPVYKQCQCISMQNLLKIFHVLFPDHTHLLFFKSYEHFNKKTLTCWNVARQSLLTVLQTSRWTIFKWISM